jgi:hypothetical protein
MNKRILISSIDNLLLIILFIIAYAVKPIHWLQTVWIIMTIITPIPVVTMMIKELQAGNKNKIPIIINIVISAFFFLLSMVLFMYALIK